MSKTVVVTGATNGTGYAIARRFAQVTMSASPAAAPKMPALPQNNWQ